MNPEKVALGEDTEPIWRCGECGTSHMREQKARDCCRESDESDASPSSPPAGESEGSLTPGDIAAHYERVCGVYDALGNVGSLEPLGNHDFIGWYRTDANAPTGFDARGRPFALATEREEVLERTDRTVYATVNYQQRDWYMNAWRAFDYTESGKQWRDEENPAPGYSEIGAYAPFADIDLADEIKQHRPQGGIPQESIERALSEYIDAFAELAGTRDAVFALDSVGGAYVLLSPTVTKPISDEFGKQGRGRIFEELTDRLNEWLATVGEEVSSTVPEVDGVFEPDTVNNKNRLYKTVMSVHTSLDGVVTPIDTDAPSYDYTPLLSVSDADVTDAEAWAESFTADHSECISEIVSSLWPDFYAEHGDWQTALLKWLAGARRREREREQAREQTNTPRGSLPSDAPTADYETVIAAADRLDVRQVAREFAAEWDTAPGRDPPRFDPSWRKSTTGESCFADREKYVDLKEESKGGGAITLAARARGYISHSKETPTGEEFRKSVAALRQAGFDVPLLESDNPTREELGLSEVSEDETERMQQLHAELEIL